MNNDSDKDLNAEISKCWTCKFGMCINEEENQTVFHEGLQGLTQEEDNVFGDEDHDTMHDYDIQTRFITAKRVNALCYWKPEGHNGPHHPTRVAQVTQCNRYDGIA